MDILIFLYCLAFMFLSIITLSFDNRLLIEHNKRNISLYNLACKTAIKIIEPKIMNIKIELNKAT
jgi:hypothetical protein